MDFQKIADLLESDLTLGTLEVRLANSAEEVKNAQELRYRVFYKEMGAKPTPEMSARELDFDAFDEHCDHLLVIDNARAGNKVVGTYRLIRRPVAKKLGAFYSASEYEISALLQYPGEILELGRSCIDAGYRTGATMQILWRGLASYIFRHNITLMFGCASFPGIDPKDHAQALSYLYYHHLAPPAIRAKALPERYVDMQLLPREAFDPNTAFDNIKMDPRSGGNNIPPLIKGYLRVGGYVGDGAVIDVDFNTTDVFITVKTELITDRYMRHYERSNKRENILP
ncbi:MAG: GNAT family N-acetyltransferase [Alphaproteobacteria bacterium]|nr:GNAT family N-acetyltransferase [Alphaproteobacteria bacterium]